MSLDAISSTLNTYSKVDTKKTDDTKQKEAVACATAPVLIGTLTLPLFSPLRATYGTYTPSAACW